MITVYGDVPAKLVLTAEAKAEKPRTLLLKILSKKEVRSWQRRTVDARVIDDVDARDKAYDALLGEVVVGWKNVDGPFSIEAISDKYSLAEFMEILDLVPMAMTLTADDLKKSVPAA